MRTPFPWSLAAFVIHLGRFISGKEKSEEWQWPSNVIVINAGAEVDAAGALASDCFHGQRYRQVASKRRTHALFVTSTPAHWFLRFASAEARALKDGLILAGNFGCSRLKVESDCMEVIDVMKNGGNSLGPAAAIYEECSFLCRNFTEVVFGHCPREANRVADLLARNSEGSQSVVWVEEPPDYIKCFLADDVTIL
ncbi:hypothetical protein QYE76_020763 [Lolium multiflorum]|uniref:RNase H type-1 domain-containing protein n=1 Tax=Lolium multiflorum TaxID=4521 RepID=A0AAD8VRM9_LOLMU|nr:hypothetical protein QYE76_020763 [Lolium multiflorum]